MIRPSTARFWIWRSVRRWIPWSPALRAASGPPENSSMKRHYPLIFPVILLLAGCQTPRPLYYWGNYETVLYQAYQKPEAATPERQVAKLEEDLTRAAAKNLQPNPGLHAQLGFAYYQIGK